MKKPPINLGPNVVRDQIARHQQRVHEAQKLEDGDARSLDEILQQLNARVDTPEYQNRMAQVDVVERERERRAAEARARHVAQREQAITRRKEAAKQRRAAKEDAKPKPPPQLTLIPGGRR